ncbi:MAG: carboxypeptidase regulatory-like domain-containing protein [Gemmatimonadetes bacterium]|nr:carboxypeptidase regulatory-like domain-containing protein [Gemmatimonadota bacterium]
MSRLLAAALLLGAALRGAAAQTPGVLYGDVVSRETGQPLEHAMVTVVSAGRQTFTTEGGVFAFRGLAPGTYRLHVTHLGYTPGDVSAVVPEDGTPPRVKVALTHLSVKLATVKVLAKPSCTNPGRPDPRYNPDLAAIVQQVRMNAEHYQLLADSFPFTYAVQRWHRMVKADSARSAADIDTLHMRSDLHGWEYELGAMVERERPGQYVMHLPELRDFAGIQFLNNHCFWYSGVDSTDDGKRIRIDFRADDQIKQPDVNGTIWLDATTYQIREADLELSKMVRELPEITAVRVKTYFGEVSPYIVIIQRVVGTNSLKHGWGPWATVASLEEQRMFGLNWMRGDPRKADPDP